MKHKNSVCKRCYNAGPLLDSLCRPCYVLTRITPLDKEINRCEQIMNECLASRANLLAELNSFDADLKRQERIEKRLQDEVAAGKLFQCKCGVHFEDEYIYARHRTDCTGVVTLTKREAAQEQSKQLRKHNAREIEI